MQSTDLCRFTLLLFSLPMLSPSQGGNRVKLYNGVITFFRSYIWWTGMRCTSRYTSCGWITWEIVCNSTEKRKNLFDLSSFESLYWILKKSCLPFARNVLYCSFGRISLSMRCFLFHCFSHYIGITDIDTSPLVMKNRVWAPFLTLLLCDHSISIRWGFEK